VNDFRGPARPVLPLPDVADFPLGSPESRAIVRAIAEATFPPSTRIITCYVRSRPPRWAQVPGVEALVAIPPEPGVNVDRSLVNLSCYRWQKHCRGLYQTPIAAWFQ
jgi:hypothetical protein